MATFWRLMVDLKCEGFIKMSIDKVLPDVKKIVSDVLVIEENDIPMLFTIETVCKWVVEAQQAEVTA